MAQTVQNLPVRQETWVQSLDLEDPLEKGMATHSSIRAWRIPWAENPGRLRSMGSQRIGHAWATNTHPHSYTYYNCSGREQNEKLTFESVDSRSDSLQSIFEFC